MQNITLPSGEHPSLGRSLTHSLTHTIHSTPLHSDINREKRVQMLDTSNNRHHHTYIEREMEVIACIEQNDNPSLTIQSHSSLQHGRTNHMLPLFIFLGFHINTVQRSVG